MADKGWIALHRSMQEHWLWEETRKFSKAEAWLDLLMMANHKDSKFTYRGRLFVCGRGEILRSLEKLRKKWGWSKSAVRRFLTLLENDGMIRHESETILTRIKVCKYEDYQPLRNADETQMKRTRNARETKAGTYNNDKNIEQVSALSKGIENPTLDQILKLVGSTPYPLTEEIAQAYFHARESVGWIKANQTITNWQADIAGFAQRWMNNERSKPKSRNRQGQSKHTGMITTTPSGETRIGGRKFSVIKAEDIKDTELSPIEEMLF